MSQEKKLRIKYTIRFFVTAGKATPAPPVGSSLGQKKVNTKLFIEQFKPADSDSDDYSVDSVDSEW